MSLDPSSLTYTSQDHLMPMAKQKAKNQGVHWSYPSQWFDEETQEYKSGGMVWMQGRPATQADVEELIAQLETDDVAVDEASLCGQWHPDYTTARDEATNQPPSTKSGGLGSVKYERQNLLDGVSMRNYEIWHFDSEGNSVFGIPQSEYGEGCAYEQWSGDYNDWYAGVQPGSAMEAFLVATGGIIIWNEERSFYVIGVGAMPPIEAGACAKCGKVL